MRVVMKLATVLILLMGSAPAIANTAMVTAVNDLRAQRGITPVRYSTQLEAAAEAHARDMARREFFSHTGSNGSSVAQRVRKAGYDFCFVAENIAMGQTNLQAVMDAWTNSRGHRRNMLDRRAQEMALVKGKNSIWVMILGTPGC